MPTVSCSLQNPAGSRTWSDLIPRIKSQVQRCPELLILSELQFTGVDFCKRTGALEKFFEIDTQEGVVDYYLEVEDCTVPIRIQQVRFESETCNYDFLPGGQNASGCWSCLCQGRRFSSESPTHIRLEGGDRIATLERSLHVTLVVAPKIDTSRIDDLLYDRWAETLCWGALSRLHQQMGSTIKPNPWYNLQQAVHFRKLYQDELGRAKLEVDRRYSATGYTRMTARRWA